MVGLYLVLAKWKRQRIQPIENDNPDRNKILTEELKKAYIQAVSDANGNTTHGQIAGWRFERKTETWAASNGKQAITIENLPQLAAYATLIEMFQDDEVPLQVWNTFTSDGNPEHTCAEMNHSTVKNGTSVALSQGYVPHKKTYATTTMFHTGFSYLFHIKFCPFCGIRLG